MDHHEFDIKWGYGGYHAAHLMAQVLSVSKDSRVLVTIQEFLEDLASLRTEDFGD